VSEQDNKSPNLSLPDRIFGRSVEGAMECVLDNDRKEKHKEVEALLIGERLGCGWQQVQH